MITFYAYRLQKWFLMRLFFLKISTSRFTNSYEGNQFCIYLSGLKTMRDVRVNHVPSRPDSKPSLQLFQAYLSHAQTDWVCVLQIKGRHVYWSDFGVSTVRTLLIACLRALLRTNLVEASIMFSLQKLHMWSQRVHYSDTAVPMLHYSVSAVLFCLNHLMV